MKKKDFFINLEMYMIVSKISKELIRIFFKSIMRML